MASTEEPARAPCASAAWRPRGAVWRLRPSFGFLLWGVLCLVAAAPLAAAGDETAAIEKRLVNTVSFLASEECEGRAAGTKGVDLAANYIAGQFRDIGLKTDLFDGEPFQRFSLESKGKVGSGTSLKLAGPPGPDGEAPVAVELKLGDEIDNGPKPKSCELSGWRVVGRVEIVSQQLELKNVVGILEGEGPRSDETIVVGAHYDHLGRRRSRAGTMEIYNGADDNASGVAAMIEVARTLAARQKRLGRRVVFTAFTAEERGLIGSSHYLDHPLVPLDQTIAMINLDMVGRLRNDRLGIEGAGTGSGFDELLNQVAPKHGLNLRRISSGIGGSDHASFYRKEIPVLCFITGVHSDLHQPTDDVEKLNFEGMRRVCQLVSDVLVELADAEERPEYKTESWSTSSFRQMVDEAILTTRDKIRDLLRP